MPCPTCDHTLSRLFGDDGGGLSWWLCPRCGTTIRRPEGQPDSVYVPKLVDRCREMEVMFVRDDGELARAWRRIGVAESINLPGNRSS